MKFNRAGENQWESPDCRWVVNKFDEREFALYDSNDGFQFVGDFPSIELASKYAAHFVECEETKINNTNERHT